VRVWRLTTARHVDTAFTGEGARLYGGRWNSRGVPIVYTSRHLSLAVLEYLVGVEVEDLPDDLVRIGAEVPDSLTESLDPVTVAPDWRSPARPALLQAAGDEWVRGARSLALEVASAVVPEERNVLINPRHPEIRRVIIEDPVPFSLDPRLRSA